MELTEYQFVEKYGKQCMQCLRKNVLPHEYERTCFSCGYIVMKRKNVLIKIQHKKLDFNNRLKYSEKTIICLCRDVSKIKEVDDNDIFLECFSTLRKKEN